ncbi:hypothetical protein HAX54_036753 [Datura stramonium]|uniref:Uncharacterized protein n=1 Tax=Datura stramonium TaxID=4076 RepID=A0ABS8VLA9_DATST|nr:hypothetical protein [Datura stramonium]
MSSVPEKNDVLSAAVTVDDDQNELVAAAAADDDDMKSSVHKDADAVSLSSSIGVLSNGDGGDDEDGEEAQSKAVPVVEGSLNSFATLEAALPFKRGLSGYYDGKSKTFMNLAEVKSVEEIEKEESPLNKRRRLTVASKTLYKWGSSSSSMPHLTSSEGENSCSVGGEQELKSSTSSTSFGSVNSATKPSIN